MTVLNQNTISLLWPAGAEPAGGDSPVHWTGDSADDIGLKELAGALCRDPFHTTRVEGVLRQLCSDPEVVRYRQEVFDDVMRLPGLHQKIEELLPALSNLADYRDWHAHDSPLYQTLARIGELELYVTVVQKLRTALRESGGEIRARGLSDLQDALSAAEDDPAFRQLAVELPDLSLRVREIASITIGVNLDEKLRPVEATILAINNTVFKGRDNFLNRMIGRKDDTRGIGPLHEVPMKTIESRHGQIALQERQNPMMFPLFRDLDHLLADIAKPIASAIKQYVRISSGFLAALLPELVFYTGAATLMRRLAQSGLPVCKPTIAPLEERVCQVAEAYNLLLALRLMGKDSRLDKVIVSNDIDLGPEGRIGILTGPNSGGKTTYTQALALLMLCFQAGLYVPGRSARLSPVDGIYTHFASDERPELEAGRLGQEATMLSAIFDYATRHSLVLLNESLSSTSPGEGLYLARDIVRALRRLGVRAIFATHLHELAANVEAINQETPGDSVVMSLVSGVIPKQESGRDAEELSQRTYKVIKGPPLGRSFAQEVASHFGISYDKLVDKLTGRRQLEG